MQGRGLFGDPLGAARVAMTRDRDPLHQRHEAIDGGRPVERVRVAERRDGAAFEEVAGEHHAGSRDEHDRVVVGVAAAQVAQLDLPVAHVHDGLLLERPIGRVDDHLAQVGGEVGQLRDKLRPARVAGPCHERPAADVAPDRRRAEDRIAERMVVVAVGVDDDLDRCGRQLAQVVEDLARLRVGGAGVDDEGRIAAEDDADVLVVERVAPDEDAIADLRPARRCSHG